MTIQKPLIVWITRNYGKNWCFQIVVLEKTLESPFECKNIKPVNPKGNQSWICFGRIVAEAEAPILWPPDVKSQLIGKHLDAGKDCRKKEGGGHRMRWLDSITMDTNLSQLQETVKDRGDLYAAVHSSGRQRSLACYNPWGNKSDTP